MNIEGNRHRAVCISTVLFSHWYNLTSL